MTLSPLNKRRWSNFKSNKRAFYSLILFSIIFCITLFAELSIKGIIKKEEIPLEVFEDNSRLILKTSMLINRKNFDIGNRSFILSNNVKIQVEYSAAK